MYKYMYINGSNKVLVIEKLDFQTVEFGVQTLYACMETVKNLEIVCRWNSVSQIL